MHNPLLHNCVYIQCRTDKAQMASRVASRSYARITLGWNGRLIQMAWRRSLHIGLGESQPTVHSMTAFASCCLIQVTQAAVALTARHALLTDAVEIPK